MDDLTLRLVILTVTLIAVAAWFTWAEQNKSTIASGTSTTEEQVLIVLFLMGGAVFIYTSVTLVIDIIHVIMEPFL